MYDFKRVIINAGHGGGDSGVTLGNFREDDQNAQIVDVATGIIRSANIEVYKVPHHLGLVDGIAHINSIARDGDICFESHRDSGPVGFDEGSFRFGCYYITGNDYSKTLSDTFAKILRKNGGNSNTWSRPDSKANQGSLGFLRDTTPIALLVEMGFIQGNNSPQHIDYLGKVLANSIIELLGKRTIIESTPIIKKPNMNYIPRMTLINYFNLAGETEEQRASRRNTIQYAYDNNNKDYLMTELLDAGTQVVARDNQISLQKLEIEKRLTEITKLDTELTNLTTLNKELEEKLKMEVIKNQETPNFGKWFVGIIRDGNLYHILNTFLTSPTTFWFCEYVLDLPQTNSQIVTGFVFFAGLILAYQKSEANKIKTIVSK